MVSGSDRSMIIGGSDIAAVMGLNPWKTPLALWAQKTGKLPEVENVFEAAEIGQELEEYVSRKFMKKTGFKLRRDSRTFAHKAYPYMVAHIDRWMVGEDALFEAKTCSAWLEKKWKGEDIPTEYVLQVNWYCGIVGKSVGYIACLIGGQKFVWKKLVFDEAVFEKQVEAARNFMENFVQTNIPPVAMADDNELLGDLFPVAADKTIFLEGENAERVNNWLEERAGAISVKKEAEAAAKEIEAKVKQLLGESEAGETDQYRFTWKTINKQEFTVKASSYRALRCVQKKEAVNANSYAKN